MNNYGGYNNINSQQHNYQNQNQQMYMDQNSNSNSLGRQSTMNSLSGYDQDEDRPLLEELGIDPQIIKA